MTQREAAAMSIRANPTNFGVCGGCGGIVTAETYICPSCLGYQINRDPAHVVEQADKLAKKASESVLPQDLL